MLFQSHGFRWRYIALVAGSLTVLLMFTGLHGLFLAKLALPEDILKKIEPDLAASTLRVFLVGAVYTAVVTVAAAFLTHRDGNLPEIREHTPAADVPQVEESGRLVQK